MWTGPKSPPPPPPPLCTRLTPRGGVASQMWVATQELLARGMDAAERDAQGSTPLDAFLAAAGAADARDSADVLSSSAAARDKVAAARRTALYRRTPDARRALLDRFLDASQAALEDRAARAAPVPA
jgi:hypothetical protein